MELLNEWLPLIVTVLLSAITIGLVLIQQEIMDNTDVIRNAYSKLLEKEALEDPYKVKKVEVVNRVAVDVPDNVGVFVNGIASYAGEMKVKIDSPVEVTNHVLGLNVNVDNVVTTTPLRDYD